MAASSVATIPDSLTADQIKRAYDLGYQDGLSATVMGHASNHTSELDRQILELQTCISQLSREYIRLLRAKNRLRNSLIAIGIVAAYFLMRMWA